MMNDVTFSPDNMPENVVSEDLVDDFDTDGAIQEQIDANWTPALPIPVTGDQRVDAALAKLTTLNADDVHSHVDVMQAVHDELREVLADGASA